MLRPPSDEYKAIEGFRQRPLSDGFLNAIAQLSSAREINLSSPDSGLYKVRDTVDEHGNYVNSGELACRRFRSLWMGDK